MTDRICEQCRWWYPHIDDQDVPESGNCRRRSPVVAQEKTRPVWPEMLGGDWCGDWQPKTWKQSTDNPSRLCGQWPGDKEDLSEDVTTDPDALCRTCRWWDPAKTAPARGRCRRALPTRSSDVSGWPRTNEDDWCAEWQKDLDPPGEETGP